MTEHEPSIPRATCGKASCGGWLEFKTCQWTGEWICSCPQCEDGEYDYDGHCRRAGGPTGSGATPWAALEYYAQEHFGVEPIELLVVEEHV